MMWKFYHKNHNLQFLLAKRQSTCLFNIAVDVELASINTQHVEKNMRRVGDCAVGHELQRAVCVGWRTARRTNMLLSRCTETHFSLASARVTLKRPNMRQTTCWKVIMLKAKVHTIIWKA